MEKLIKLSILVLGLSLTRCSSVLYQVVELEPKNTQTNNDGYPIFENDTVRITYSFWDKNGIMAFQIFNKSNKDLYINWEKSSFIVNSQKFKYWEDKTTISSGAVYLSKKKAGYFDNFGVGLSSSTIVKDEKISFIPPQSYIYKYTYVLHPGNYFPLSPNQKKIYVKKDDTQPRSTVRNVYYIQDTFTENNSPMMFRNYLNFSFEESFIQKFSYDNAFYVKKVLEFEKRLKDTLFVKAHYSFYKETTSNYRAK